VRPGGRPITRDGPGQPAGRPGRPRADCPHRGPDDTGDRGAGQPEPCPHEPELDTADDEPDARGLHRDAANHNGDHGTGEPDDHVDDRGGPDDDPVDDPVDDTGHDPVDDTGADPGTRRHRGG
jgi:hypothetical protein